LWFTQWYHPEYPIQEEGKKGKSKNPEQSRRKGRKGKGKTLNNPGGREEREKEKP
jgi:hypothetical protein